MPANDNERGYLRTHPWISFNFDLNQLDYQIWLLIGEAQSKCEHIKGAPLLPETIIKMYQAYLAKGALATTAIEGNTLTEEEVEKRIKGELQLPPSRDYLGKEIDNIVFAYNKIGKELLKEKESDKLSVEKINEYNKIVLKDLPLNEGVIPGQIRNYSVVIANYRGVPPEDCEYLLEEYCHWLNDQFPLQIDNKFALGLIKAILAHVYFVWIHPYGDGNGRTARLIEFQILLSVGLPPVAAHLLSNHYNATRTEYYRYLDLTSKNKEYVVSFIKYALQGFVDGLKEEIDSIQKQQVEVHWINHIYNSFQGKKSSTDERKRNLLLELSKNHQNKFDFSVIRHTTPRIAEMYAGISDLTLKRDLAELTEMKLLIKSKNEYTCNYAILKIYRIPGRE
jgi:Fic family protein